MKILILNCDRFRDDTLLEWLEYKVIKIKPDIICLQEADMEVVSDLFSEYNFYRAGKKKSNKWSVPVVGLLPKYEIVWKSTHSRTLPLVILNTGTGVKFCLINIHLKAAHGMERFVEERVNGLQSVLTKVGNNVDPTLPIIICGDFNAPLSEPCIDLLDHLYRVNLNTNYTLTLKSGFRMLVDHVFVSGGVNILTAETCEAPSDHSCIVIDISVPSGSDSGNCGDSDQNTKVEDSN